MQVTSKFNIGDVVWFIGKNKKANFCPIVSIDAKESILGYVQGEDEKPTTIVTYFVNIHPTPITNYEAELINETQLFYTREELLESL